MGGSLHDYEAVMKAVADPMRARILKLLENRELCVRDLIGILGLAQSTVSGHLVSLVKAGLVEGRRHGKWSYYSLPTRVGNHFAPPILALLMGWLDDDAQVRADKRRLRALNAKGKHE